jgi:hypothetical protein
VKKMGEKREKFYTVSARLVFSSLMVILIVALVLSLSVALGIIPFNNNASTSTMSVTTTVAPLVIGVTCSSTYPYTCQDGSYNYSTGILSVALSQNTGYNWTSVTVRFVPSNTIYTNGTPEVSWSPPQAVNVTGGLLSNATKYVSIPITSGPLAVGTNITGSIWAKYQLQVGEAVSYANISSAIITVR